jgi:hypothetical protein
MKTNAAFALALFCVSLAPAAATATTQEDQRACMNDALTICAQFVPDRDRVAGCLVSNRSRISVACRIALNHFNPVVQTAKHTAAR